MKHDKMPQVIETQRCFLRPFKQGDANDMYRYWCQDERVTKMLSWFPHQSLNETEEILAMWLDKYQESPFYHWAIVMKNGGHLVGTIGLIKYSEAHARGEIGYCLAYDYWHQGLMTEVLKAMISYLFEVIGFHKLYARHIKGNDASGKVMMKCGLIKEGVMRHDQRHKDGTWVDMISYAIIKDDGLKD